MNINKIMCFLALSLLINNSIFAEGVSLIGSIQHTLKQESLNLSKASKDQNHETIDKTIQLLQIELSDEAKALLTERARQIQAYSHASPKTLTKPEKIQLGMNKVPVLDQGIHGTCTMFAMTAAIDAVIGKGDYVSQLCQLQLGNYLELHGYDKSGWNGTWPINVITQIQQYGVVNKALQNSKGCGGVYSYPTLKPYDSKSFIEPEAFIAMSEFVFGKTANWASLSDLFSPPEKKLHDVKQELESGNRVVFAVLLPHFDLGTAGAVGKHKTWFYKDSWVLTPEILKTVNKTKAAHAMVITGYDDNAVAVDPNGIKHRGLLTIRNSWGESLGNYGEFYMSYDYFILLSYSLNSISSN